MDISIKKNIPLALRRAIEVGLKDKSHLVTIEIVTNSEANLRTVYIKDKDKDSPFNFCITIHLDYEEFVADLWIEPIGEDSIVSETLLISSFDEIKKILRKWILVIEKYNEHSSLFDSPLDNFSKINFEDTDEFTDEEKYQIKQAINKLKATSKQQLELSGDQSKLLNDKLDYLIEAVDRSNKFDWKSIAVGMISNIIVALSFDTNKGKHLWALFMDAMKSIPKLLNN